ncbi:MAG: hypothetical protein M3235_09780 [Actinomycetota bacterium]|nr:hypothetical protein [Actinomycetota bacterium]
MVTADPTTLPRARPLVRDVVLSAVAMVLAGTVVAVGVTLAVLLVAHPPTSSTGALVSVGGPVVVAIAAGFAGLAVTVVRIVDRRASWPFALATLVVCTLAVGLAGYAASGYLAVAG